MDNGTLFVLKKEGNSDTCYTWVSLEDTTLSEISQSQKGKHYMIPLIWGTWSSEIHREESRVVVSRGWGAGDVEG